MDSDHLRYDALIIDDDHGQREDGTGGALLDHLHQTVSRPIHASTSYVAGVQAFTMT